MAKRKLNLTRLSDEQLLDLRMSDLDVSIEDSSLASRIDQLNDELAARDLNFRPHFWLSDDWFSPDGVPGIAIPFYLAHPRLIRLERKQLLEVEGGTREGCMKILRHEAGHAIDTAFKLRRKARYRQLFGKASQPYPETYQPTPSSRDYVLHLDMWYAQAHPLEDFAETFAVWLRPGSRWRTRYQDWPAIEKLKFVDGFMKSIRGTKPQVISRRKVDPISRMRKNVADALSSQTRTLRAGLSQYLRQRPAEAVFAVARTPTEHDCRGIPEPNSW